MSVPLSVNIISTSTCCEVTELTDIICNTGEKTPSSSLLIVVTDEAERARQARWISETLKRV